MLLLVLVIIMVLVVVIVVVRVLIVAVVIVVVVVVAVWVRSVGGLLECLGEIFDLGECRFQRLGEVGVVGDELAVHFAVDVVRLCEVGKGSGGLFVDGVGFVVVADVVGKAALLRGALLGGAFFLGLEEVGFEIGPRAVWGSSSIPCFAIVEVQASVEDQVVGVVDDLLVGVGAVAVGRRLRFVRQAFRRGWWGPMLWRSVGCWHEVVVV